jgi:hypothetical protein
VVVVEPVGLLIEQFGDRMAFEEST